MVLVRYALFSKYVQGNEEFANFHLRTAWALKSKPRYLLVNTLNVENIMKMSNISKVFSEKLKKTQ